MHNYDDVLQRKLHDLETGVSLDQTLAGLQQEAGELEPLLRLATAVRNLPHPQPASQQAGMQRRKVFHAARNVTSRRPRRWELSWLNFGLGPRFASALGLFLAVFLFAGFALVGLGLWLRGGSVAHAATLMDVSGQVEVATAQASGEWRIASEGERVRTGDRLRTGAGSHATLVFFDGSRTSLSPDADLTLTQVDGDRGNVLRVALTLSAGKSSHSVVPLRGAKSSFSVLTPSGVASVHGTTFRVAVDQDGDARFAVNTGQVLVSNDASEVFLEAGQATTSEDDQVLESPAYQFNLQGELSIDGSGIWSVSGVPFSVLVNTVVLDNPEAGDIVSVEGRVVEGTWIADLIEPYQEDEPVSAFTGVIQSIEGNIWTIGGRSVTVDTGTERGANLVVGVPVRVEFRLVDGSSLLALKIEPLQETSPEATELPTATPDSQAKPDLSFDPADLQFEVCQANELTAPGYIGTLRNQGSDADDQALDVELSSQVVGGAEFVDWVEMTPTGFESIEAGQAVNFGVRPVLKETWDAAAEGSEVKVRVFVVREANRPDHLKTRLTITLVKRCIQATVPPSVSPVVTDTVETTPSPTVTSTVETTPTLTVTPTLTMTVTPTPVITGTVTPVPTVTDCTGANPHPKGTSLAVYWGVTYEEIMGWFCQGFGFGEIDLAYELSRESGLPVLSVFELRRSGLGWGEIKQQLAPKPTKDKGNPGQKDALGNPGNSNGQGNPSPMKTQRPKKK